MHPAEINLSSDIDTIIIVDKTADVTKNATNSERVLSAVTSGKLTLNSVVKKEEILNTLVRMVQDSERFTLANDQILSVAIGANNSQNKIGLDSLCRKWGADGVVVLASIEETSNELNSENSSKEPAVQAVWKLFDANGVEVDYAIIKSTLKNSSQRYPNLKNGEKLSISPSSEVAVQYLRRLSPSYYIERRFYYTKGAELMKNGASAMKLEDYSLVKNFWLSLSEEKGLKKKVLRRVAHNLALIYEIEGDFDSALLWAGRAVRMGNAPSLRYEQELIQLVNEQPLISFQLKRK